MLQDAKPAVGVGAGYLFSISAGQVVEKRGEVDREWKLEEDGTLRGVPRILPGGMHIFGRPIPPPPS
jgi:hypothetical protein